MPEPFLIPFTINAFFLTYFAILGLLSARFLLKLSSARIALGVGPQLLIIDLNKFRYQINWIPLFLCDVGFESTLKRSQSLLVYLMTALGLLLAAFGCIYAGLILGERDAVMSRPDSNRDAQISIRQVEAGSAAEQAGLKAGMIVLQANGRPVMSGLDLITRYNEPTDKLELEVLPDSAASSPTKLTINKESKKAKALGITYGIESSLQPSTSTNRILQVTQTAWTGIKSTGKLGRAHLKLVPANLRVPSQSFANFNLLLFSASTALVLAIFAFLLAVFDESCLLWGLFFAYVAFGYWKLTALVVIVLAFFYIFKKIRLALFGVSLLWVFIFFPVPLAVGFYEGMLTRIAALNGFEVLWPL